MKYVKQFDILGIATAQISCIELQGVPNAATEGAVGLLGIDVNTHELYKCVKAEGSVYTWEQVAKGKDGVCIVKAEINSLGELVLTLSDGNTINAGKTTGKDGVDGKDGKDGVGVGVESVEVNADGELIVTYTNGDTHNAGVVKGEKGEDGVSIVKVDISGAYELLITLSNGTVVNLGQVSPTLQDILGTAPIGDDLHYIYYDGEKFVERIVGVGDDATEWSQIALMADKISKGEKTPEELGLAVGQEKTITLTTGEEVTFVILGFNHDDLADGSGRKAGITFGMKNLLATKYSMGSYSSLDDTYSYVTSTMRTTTLQEIHNMLPTDLQVVIKSVVKQNYKRVDGAESTVESTDRLFLFSREEMDSTGYDYYANAPESARAKSLSNGTGELTQYWLRDATLSKDSEYYIVYHYLVKVNGVANGTGTGHSPQGVCFGFGI